MEKIGVDGAIKIFKILSQNYYSSIWSLIEDFEVNGHIVKVKSSTLWNHVIIDNGFVPLSEDTVITAVNGKTYNGLDFARHILES